MKRPFAHLARGLIVLLALAGYFVVRHGLAGQKPKNRPALAGNAPLPQTTAPAAATTTPPGEAPPPSNPCANWRGARTAFPDCAVLPLTVASAIVINGVEKVDETNQVFTADFDLRLEWRDPRNAFDAKTAGVLRRDWSADAAQAQAGRIWVPPVLFANKSGDLQTTDSALSIHADGETVWSRRLHGDFAADLDLDEFPFDAQNLTIALEIPSMPARSVVFVHQDEQRRRSAIRPGVDTPSWLFSRLRLEAGERRMISGEKTSTLQAAIHAERQATPYIPPLFLPLIVTIFLPILALWIVDTDVHERVNWVLTGVFALIAFNFTVTLQYPMLGPGSTVMQFFWIGYGLQCAVFSVILLLYNGSFSERWVSPWMQETVLSWLRWAVPVTTVALMAYSMLLAAS